MQAFYFLVIFQAEDFHLAMTAELLGIDRNQLRKWLCNRKIVTVGEVLIKPLTVSEVRLFGDLP